MARQNYSYAKRQRELEKKQKKEERRKRKEEKNKAIKAQSDTESSPSLEELPDGEPSSDAK